jgi:hypothetical protein
MLSFASGRSCPMTATISIRRFLQTPLTQHTLTELRAIEVEETEYCVKLVGRVSRYYIKLMAQEAIKAHAGDREIMNQLEVDEIDLG